METYGEAKQSVPQKVISSKIDQLLAQQDRMQSLLKDWYSFGDRIKRVGMSLNSNSHPANSEQNSAIKSDKISAGVPKMEADGIVGVLDRLISNNYDFMEEFNNGIFPYLDNNLAYIEQHL